MCLGQQRLLIKFSFISAIIAPLRVFGKDRINLVDTVSCLMPVPSLGVGNGAGGRIGLPIVVFSLPETDWMNCPRDAAGLTGLERERRILIPVLWVTFCPFTIVRVTVSVGDGDNISRRPAMIA
jgi:hypothetical protein